MSETEREREICLFLRLLGRRRGPGTHLMLLFENNIQNTKDGTYAHKQYLLIVFKLSKCFYVKSTDDFVVFSMLINISSCFPFTTNTLAGYGSIVTHPCN